MRLTHCIAHQNGEQVSGNESCSIPYLWDRAKLLFKNDRQEMVKVLSAEGMSTRAIAPIVGSNKETVRQDLAGANKLAPPPKSDAELLAEALGDEPMRLARDERQEMVKVLSAEGMSTRAIAPIVGVNRSNVTRDLQVVHGAPPEPKSEDEQPVEVQHRGQGLRL